MDPATHYVRIDAVQSDDASPEGFLDTPKLHYWHLFGHIVPVSDRAGLPPE